MPRGDQLARALTLAEALRVSRRGLPAAVLAARHGWNVRTVYRDLHALEQAGYPVTQDGSRWKLVDGWNGSGAFPLSLEERLGLALARRLATPLRGTPAHAAFERLCDRLAGCTGPLVPGARPGELFPRVRSVVSTVSSFGIDYAAHEATIRALCRACESRRTVRAVYWAESRRDLTRREIDPYCLHWDHRLEALYLIGWCRLRRELRTFAVHRFRQVVLTKRGFEIPAEFSPESYLAGAFRVWRDKYSVPVRLRVDRSVAGWVSERRWHPSQELHRRPDGDVELAFRLAASPEVQRFVLQFGAAVEVLEPGWLRRDVAREHAAAARRGERTVEESVTPDVTKSAQNGGRKGRRNAGTVS